ncbi:MAG TPA: radical SAM protein [Candidatus Nanopelagicaceae bacterium]|nr:radical SAM protein [Candidatus Nanopelagicaceae bacterium]
MEQELISKKIKRKKKQQIAELALAAKAAKERGGKPFIFHFLTTLKCNCDCETCLWKNNTKKDELTLEEIKRIYLEAKEAGFLVTILWGGEPLIRKDITEIIKFVKRELKFTIVGIVTNGWFLPAKIKEIGNDIDFILISLDSPRPEEHDQIRGLPGLYDKIMDSVTIVKESYPLISLQFSFSISKYNINRVEEMIILSDKIGIPVAFNVINTVRHYSHGDKDEKGMLSANEKDLSNAFERILDAKKNGSKVLNSEMYLNHFIGGKKQYQCHTKKVFMFVNYNGDIENCLQIDKPIANLRQTSVSEVLQLPQFIKFIKESEKCYSCNSPTMIDTSYLWDDIRLLTKSGGISFG